MNAEGKPVSQEKRRISKSRSGFDKEGRAFVIVYKTAEGQYEAPIKLASEQALAIAKTYAVTKSVPNGSPVDASVARHILRQAIARGLIDQTSAKPSKTAFGMPADWSSIDEPSVDQETIEQEEITDSPPANDIQPKYLPAIDNANNVSGALAEETIDILAFVLSGIDPSLRTDAQTLKANLRLKDLASTPSSRVPADLILQEEHRFVLQHLQRLSVSEFRQLWDEAKTPKKGQLGTEIQRIATKFEKSKIDEAGKFLKDPTNKELFQEFRTHAVEILVRALQRARRRIHAFHEQPEAKPTNSNWLVKLKLRRPPPNIQPTTVVVADEVRQLVREYVDDCLKLARILRSEILRGH